MEEMKNRKSRLGEMCMIEEIKGNSGENQREKRETMVVRGWKWWDREVITRPKQSMSVKVKRNREKGRWRILCLCVRFYYMCVRQSMKPISPGPPSPVTSLIKSPCWGFLVPPRWPCISLHELSHT